MRGGCRRLALAYDVLLVRHGESEANALGRFAYRSWDPHLTAQGQSQAQQLANQLSETSINHIVTSPLLRAQETIFPLSLRHHVDPIILDNLAEVNLGLWDGARVQDLESEGGHAFVAWRQDPEANPPPGGESILAVGHRVLDALRDFIINAEPGLTVAATHADCIKGAILVITGSPGATARSLYVPNLGQVLLRYVVPSRRWIILLFPLDFQGHP